MSGEHEVGLSYLSVVMIVIFLLTWLILKYTRVGRGVYAIGGKHGSGAQGRLQGRRSAGLLLFLHGVTGRHRGACQCFPCQIRELLRPGGNRSTSSPPLLLAALPSRAGEGRSWGPSSESQSCWLYGIVCFVGIPSSWQAFMVGIIILASIVVSSLRRKGRSGR